MSILLTTELTKMQDVSIHKDVSLLQSSIDIVENMYIKKGLSSAMYVYLLKNKEQATQQLPDPSFGFVVDILNGATYGETGDEKIFIGLKQIISSLAFCDLCYKNISVTRFGSVQKQDQYSISADLDKIQMNVSRIRTAALLQLDDVREYIQSIDTTTQNEEQVKVIKSVTQCDNEEEKLLDEWL